ncbi:MAG: NAD+ synthase [Deltaproteobacteria bacterium]|nr:NAD+ synthase [Candidatus Anaeroferrophillacea bacterium]
MKIALMQLNPTVGDLAGNLRLLQQALTDLPVDPDLAITSELFLTGYPPRDLLEHDAFIRRAEDTLAELVSFSRTLTATAMLIGTARPAPSPADGRRLLNTAVLICDGEIVATRAKTLLPEYDVFDERRYFRPSAPNKPVEFRGERLGITICEDAWSGIDLAGLPGYAGDPLGRLTEQGATLLLNLSASPFQLGKSGFRRELFRRQAARLGRPLVMVNQTGGNDELVFDGHSLAIDGKGCVVLEAAGFTPDGPVVTVTGGGTITVSVNATGSAAPATGIEAAPEEAAAATGAVEIGGVETAVPGTMNAGSGEAEPGEAAKSAAAPAKPGTAKAAPPASPADRGGLEELRRALVLGIADYCRTCGFGTALVGLSGGIDSALVAALARDALGADNVRGVGLPSPYSSPGSIEDARRLAANLGIRFDLVPISAPFAALNTAMEPLFAGRAPDLTEENLQARIRGTILMALSNKFGHLLLATGNKSELAVGYCTLYGDMCGGLAPIGDLPKTTVYRLARHLNRNGEIIPESTLVKAPSAELRPDQKDEDSLPPYALLDEILALHLDERQGLEAIAARGIDRETAAWVLAAVRRSEYKRRQAAPVLKVTVKSFGSGRRMPIAARYEL